MPLYFEPNVGQASRDVEYVVRARQYAASFDAQHFSLALHSTGHVIRTTFAGASASAKLIAEQHLAGRINYFRGSDPSNWHTDVPTFGQLRVSQLYPGVDIVYQSGRGGNVQYDLYVAPATAVEQVRLAFDGLSATPYVDASSGALALHVNGTYHVHHTAPVMYQEVDDSCVLIDGGFTVRGAIVGFWVGMHNDSLPLHVDPLVYSTYIGGAQSDWANVRNLRDVYFHRFTCL